MSRNLIHIKDFSKEELYEVFRLADQIAVGGYPDKILQGKTIFLFFPESSIRTRVTFEKGIRQLGGDTILFPPSALDKRERPEDVIGYLENWADAVVVRHSDLALEKISYAPTPSRQRQKKTSRVIRSRFPLCKKQMQGRLFAI